MTFLRLLRDEKQSCTWFEELIHRVQRFSHRHQTRSEYITEQLWRGFASRDPACGAWVAFNEDGDICGHAVGQVQVWSGEWVGWVFQCEMDEWASNEVHDGFLHALDQWIREWNQHVGQTRPDMLARSLMFATPYNARAMAKHSGFTPEMTIMRRVVP